NNSNWNDDISYPAKIWLGKTNKKTRLDNYSSISVVKTSNNSKSKVFGHGLFMSPGSNSKKNSIKKFNIEEVVVKVLLEIEAEYTKNQKIVILNETKTEEDKYTILEVVKT
ncbi:3202_t:CDS:2, partial [Gigaspora margarita]